MHYLPRLFLFSLILLHPSTHAGSHEDWLNASPCNRLWFNLDEITNQPAQHHHDRSRHIQLLEHSLLATKHIEDCWFTFKVYHKLAELYYNHGDRFRQAMHAQHQSYQHALAQFNAGGQPPYIVVLPALALIRMLHESGPGTSTGLKQEDSIWAVVQQVTGNDRSLRILAASHVSWMLATEEDSRAIYTHMLNELQALLIDPTMDCLYGHHGKRGGITNAKETIDTIDTMEQCHTKPQNYSSWYPLYSTFYHLFEAQDILHISTNVSTLYRKSTRSLSWVAEHLRRPAVATTATDPTIRIGFISSMFQYDHSLGQHIRGVIDGLQQNHKYTVVLVHLNDRRQEYDNSTAGDILIGNDVFLSNDVSLLPTQREYIANLKLDMIVYPEIGMEPNAYFLAFSRLAPVQIATWCFPQSLATGAIDYFISSDHLELDGGEGLGQEPIGERAASFTYYDEQLVQFRKAPPWYFYKEDAERKFTSPAEQTVKYNPFQMTLEERKKVNIYFIPQDSIKLHYTFNYVLEHILLHDSNGVVALIVSPKRKDFVYHRFKGRDGGGSGGGRDGGSGGESGGGGGGGDGSRPTSYNFDSSSFSSDKYKDRVVLLPRTKSRYEFRRLLSMVDVILDPWPWGGWTTTLQALSANVPVVTLPGNDARSRFTWGIYQSLNMSEVTRRFVADDVDDYVTKAIEVGRNELQWVGKTMLAIKKKMEHTPLLEHPNTPVVWDAFLSRAHRLHVLSQ